MTNTVTLPIWLLTLILLFAAVTASTHLLFPSVRWFFRRRAERLVAKLNERLDRPIQPFKLLRRQDMIQRVIYDADVVREVGEYARTQGVREDVAFEKASDYAREIVPSFSATAYFGIATRVSRAVAKWLFDVRVNYLDEAALSEVDKDATVVYVINHRSNFDYVLVTYLAAKQSALSYAVGEWARVWPMSVFIRATGAYYIRRRTPTPLYRRVLSSYVQRATEAGVSQAVFPEGGLSRNGVVGLPKLGILSYVVDGWRDGKGRDVIFVPVSLNYDRVVEDRVLITAGRTGQQRFRRSIGEGIHFATRYAYRRMRGKVGRFGVAAVTFGRPISISEMAKSEPDDLVLALGEACLSQIREITPVTTAPLAMAAMFQLQAPVTKDALLAEMTRLRSSFPAEAANEPEEDKHFDRVLSVMVLRELLTEDADGYTIADPELAAFYANSLRPHLDRKALELIPEPVLPEVIKL
ncbi:MAG: glycerol-3-phosphate acyltransferase [Silicimonas sp.]|nr:glycerol-3-phosphate acyltransferase [Silicimonas sp.]